jgi:hypothetical protein
MAEETQASASGDLQRLVRTIVVDLMSQEQNSPLETVVSNTGNRFDSVDQELNGMLRIPRGIPHENMPLTSGNLNTARSAPNDQRSIAMNFNSRQNYGRINQPRKRQIVRQTATQSGKRSRTQSSDANSKYLKNVFLLPSPTWLTVPRRENKMFLQTQNLVVDAFLIDKRWNYEELRTEFSQLFSKVLLGEYESIGYVTQYINLYKIPTSLFVGLRDVIIHKYIICFIHICTSLCAFEQHVLKRG